jgi:hypothetical protein
VSPVGYGVPQYQAVKYVPLSMPISTFVLYTLRERNWHSSAEIGALWATLVRPQV